MVQKVPKNTTFQLESLCHVASLINMTKQATYKLSIWPQLIVLSIAQLFNHLMDRSLKIFAVYVHSDLGISLSTLSMILTFGSYGPFIVFLSSHFYHYIPSNVVLFIMELTGCLTMLFIYFYGYQFVWILFICRLLFSSSIKGIFTYTNTMIAYYVPHKQDVIRYISIFDSAYVASTFLFILTGYIINENNGLFHYFMIYSIISFIFSIILLLTMPKTKTELGTESQIINLENCFWNKIYELSHDLKFILLLFICFFEQISQSIFNICIGVFIKKSYNADPFQLGLYTTLTQGFAQLIGVLCIAFIFGKCIKQNYFIFIFGLLELTLYLIFYILQSNNQQIYVETSLSIMFFVSLGHMGLYYGLVIILIKTVPNYQQSVACAIWSIADILGGSSGTFTVARIAKYNQNDIKLYSIILLIVYSCCMINIFFWCYKSNGDNITQRSELQILNKNKENRANYHSVDTELIDI